MPIAKNRDEIEVLPRIPGTIGAGSKNVTTAGSRVQITTTSTPTQYIIITAKVANTGTIWVGDVTVANGTGHPLLPAQVQTIHIDDISKIYIDSTVSNEGVTFIYVI